MNKPSLQITAAEWDVMQAIWRRDGQLAGELIAEVQASRDWNHRTIRTLLARVVEKGAVGVRVEGSKHFYHALVTKEECVRSAAKSFSERFFAGDVKALLMHFVEHEPIAADELEDIRRMLLSKPKPSQRKRKK